jgi:hypothetical protein
MMLQPRFLEVEMKERMMAKSSAPSWQWKPPEIFFLDLNHAAVAFGLIVSEGHGRIVKEAQGVPFAIDQGPDEIMSGPSRLAAAPGVHARRSQAPR